MRKFAILCVTMITLLIPTSLYAQSCSNGVCIPQQRFIPVQQQKFVPQQKFVQKQKVVDEVVVKQKVVEFDADYFLGLDGYYSVAEQLRARERIKAELRQQEVIDRQQNQIDELLKIVKELIKNQKGNTDDGEIPDENDDVSWDIPPADDQDDIPVGDDDIPTWDDIPVGESNETLADQLDAKVYNIFATNCASCHEGAGSKAGVTLIGKDLEGNYLVDLSLEERLNVLDVVSSTKDDLLARGKKFMPIGGQPLTPEEIDAIREWVLVKQER